MQSAGGALLSVIVQRSWAGSAHLRFVYVLPAYVRRGDWLCDDHLVLSLCLVHANLIVQDGVVCGASCADGGVRLRDDCANVFTDGLASSPHEEEEEIVAHVRRTACVADW